MGGQRLLVIGPLRTFNSEALDAKPDVVCQPSIAIARRYAGSAPRQGWDWRADFFDTAGCYPLRTVAVKKSISRTTAATSA